MQREMLAKRDIWQMQIEPEYTEKTVRKVVVADLKALSIGKVDSR